MAPSDPKVLVDQVRDLSAAKETVLLLGLLFLQTDSSFETGIMHDSSTKAPLAFMTIVRLHDFVKVSISTSLESFFADHVH